MSKPSRESHSATDTAVPGDTAAGGAPVQVHFDPTPPLAHDVLTLFRGAFAEVRFPDVDRSSLEADRNALLMCQAEVEALERELERARLDTREAAAVLNTSAGRALAYATIFASGQPALEEALRAVRSGQADATSERGPKKRRGRPSSHGGEQLPIEASASAARDEAPGADPERRPEADDAEEHDTAHDQAAE